jgi:hypothetical protein
MFTKYVDLWNSSLYLPVAASTSHWSEHGGTHAILIPKVLVPLPVVLVVLTTPWMDLLSQGMPFNSFHTRCNMVQISGILHKKREGKLNKQMSPVQCCRKSMWKLKYEEIFSISVQNFNKSN